MLDKSSFKTPAIPLEGETELTIAVPEEENLNCPVCERLQTKEALQKLDYVCNHCGHHFRMPARMRILSLAEEGSFIEHDKEMASKNLISFSGYEEKLLQAAEVSGEKEAVITGVMMLGGIKTTVFSMESRFMMGSMGSVVGEKLTNLFEYATREKLPVLGFTVSGGARMQEGIFSLMQMAKVSGAVKRHSNAGLFYLTVLTDPTTGGVTASFAMEGDIILAEPNALIAFAGPRVIEQTIRRKLPENFQRAEMLLEKGFVDAIVPRMEQKEMIETLLYMHKGGNHASI
ncbi:MAG: acetyl-CoA carboxylase, carboxyltransferase subunit beta [Christensenellaceae bacterium]|jgi:acetyl-CoA carboxylase carboxyl transferase beta subunit